MQTNCTELERDSAPDTPKYFGVIHDKRTRRWRAVQEVAARLTAQAGGEDAITPAQREMIARAAELTILSQGARIRALHNPHPDVLNALVRLENLASRALKGINRSKPKPPSLQEYLANRGGGA